MPGNIDRRMPWRPRPGRTAGSSVPEDDPPPAARHPLLPVLPAAVAAGAAPPVARAGGVEGAGHHEIDGGLEDLDEVVLGTSGQALEAPAVRLVQEAVDGFQGGEAEG